MEKEPGQTRLEKLQAYFAGEADEDTRREVSEELRRADSPLAAFMHQVTENSRQWLGGLLQKGGRDEGNSQT